MACPRSSSLAGGDGHGVESGGLYEPGVRLLMLVQSNAVTLPIQFCYTPFSQVEMNPTTFTITIKNVIVCALIASYPGRTSRHA